jgi:SAM-dependent methyltransferase
LLPYRIWKWLAFTRVPGNALSFWMRRTLRWSRGIPSLPNESKTDLFAYLDAEPAGTGLLAVAPLARENAEARESELRERYRLEPLRSHSTVALYRKNLYLLDILEEAAHGLDLPPRGTGPDGLRPLRALDVGSQDWHYVFALERWLAQGAAAQGAGTHRDVVLRGVELDGYGIYPDLRSRCDYARAYAAQTGNPSVAYEVADFLDVRGSDLDVITWFYPFVARHHLLLWGLPLRHFAPARLIEKAAMMLRPGGWLAAFTHTLPEQEAFLALCRADGRLEPVRAGEARSRLVDFHNEVEDRRFSLWRRK